jgi:hypothetical protein
MKKTEIKAIDTEVITDVVCNNCGESCRSKAINENFEGLIEVEVNGGYGAECLEDMIKYKFSLCEKCLSEMFSKFKIQPEKIQL